jgi:retron-type reverse transcriptase
MKRHGNLFPTFISFENLYRAYKKAKKGATGKQETQQFTFHLEEELFCLQQELIEGIYEPQPYRYFRIYDPKERLISVAAFRDRVVHHALINMYEPIYERSFIHDSYATRKEKGTHKAVARAQQFLRRGHWFWKCDIDKYFDSIQQEVLLEIIQRKIKDKSLLAVTARIICNGGQNGIGLPIGNLTSQFFANVYLDRFDYFIKEEQKMPYYLRYMDDFVLFHPEKKVLKNLQHTVKHFLADELGLRLKPSACYFNQAANGLTFLGRRIFPNTIRIARPNLQRMKRRMARRQQELEQGVITVDKFLASMNSYQAQTTPFSGLYEQLWSTNNKNAFS